jgi:hypothetical protein
MALMITWRNPCPVQTAQPRKKLSDHASESIHIVQKAISRAQSRQWVDMPFLNVLCGVPLGARRGPHKVGSRGTRSKPRKPAAG